MPRLAFYKSSDPWISLHVHVSPLLCWARMPAVGCHGPKKDLWVSLGRCCHCFSLRALQAAPGNIFNSTSNFNLKFEKEGENDKMSMSGNLTCRACKCTQSGLLWWGGCFSFFVAAESDSTPRKGPSGMLKELKGNVMSQEETSRSGRRAF